MNPEKKRQEREQIRRDTEEFLARGGRIQHIAPGVVTDKEFQSTWPRTEVWEDEE